jgi:AraC-like DNA-binding protein
MKEQVKFWRSPQFADLELLHARFITHSFCRHTHNTYAIGVIQRGAEEFTYRGSTHVAEAGSIALINPGEPHDGHAASEGGWMYRMLYPDVSILQQAMADLWRSPNIPYFPHPVIQDEYIKGLLLRLHITLEASPCQLEQDSRMVWTMAQLIARHAGDRPTFKTIGKESNPIQLVQDYLETHYAENPSLEELAAIANLSPFYLLRTFRKQVGLPPHGYLNQVRLNRAKRLLAQGKPISDVAQETGFADQSHLTRQFKRMTGVTPGQYQR